MSWIKLVLHPHDPKVAIVAQEIGASKAEAYVALIRWLFHVLESGRGDCFSITKAGIQAVTDQPRFADAIAGPDIGWIKPGPAGTWRLTEEGLAYAGGKRDSGPRRVDPEFAWVYFLLRNYSVCYVGQTIDLPARLSAHRLTKTFDSWWAKRVPFADLDAIEVAHIKRLDPPDNKKHTDRDPSRRKKGVRS